MTITQLYYVLAVAEYKNFTLAAEKCFVTQPTLSMQIQKLEDELDFEEIMIEKMENFSLEELEEMTMKIAKNELKHIEYIGAVLGGIIGVVQFIVAKFI